MQPSRPRQTTPAELRDTLLNYIQKHFYSGHAVSFQKDRPRLLKWVVLKLATWLDTRAVTLSPARYEEIMIMVLRDARNLGRFNHITYLPAYLGRVIDAHLAHHGEEYYEEAKQIRAQVDHVSMHLGRLQSTTPDPIRQLAQAAKLLQNRKTPKRSDHQLDLL